jgi:hypothetical protein
VELPVPHEGEKVPPEAVGGGLHHREAGGHGDGGIHRVPPFPQGTSIPGHGRQGLAGGHHAPPAQDHEAPRGVGVVGEVHGPMLSPAGARLDPMGRPPLSEAQEDYLKQLFAPGGSPGGQRAHPGPGGAPRGEASLGDGDAEEAFKALGLVEHSPYRGARLTEAGRKGSPGGPPPPPPPGNLPAPEPWATAGRRCTRRPRAPGARDLRGPGGADRKGPGPPPL